MVEAGFTDTSALWMMPPPLPSSGRATSDRLPAFSLLAVSACCTLAGSVLLTWAAERGRVTGRRSEAMTMLRSVLIIWHGPRQKKGREEGAAGVILSRIMPHASRPRGPESRLRGLFSERAGSWRGNLLECRPLQS